MNFFRTDFALSSREKHHLRMLCTLSLFVGLIYVFGVRAGLPYDEAAHWNIVRHYARGDFLPVMGTRGVSYEAYQAPAFYLCGGFLTFFTQMLGERFAFYALRCASLLLLLPTIWCSYAIARRVLQRHADAFPVALFVGLNPGVLAIFSSVQNDAPAIALSLWILTLCLRDTVQASSTRSAVLLGAVTGAAILFKLTAAFAVFAVLIYAAFVQRNARQWLRFFVVYSATIAAICGWWFARNIALYGDFSGSAAMLNFFPEGAGTPLNLAQSASWKSLAQNFVTYWWTPTEYYRNSFELPRLAKGSIAFATLLGLVGSAWSVLAWRTKPLVQQRAALTVALFYAVCVAIYFRTVATQWFFPSRMTLVVAVVPALLIAGGSRSLLRRMVKHRVLEARAGGAFWLVVLLLLNVVVLRGAMQLRAMPVDMTFAASLSN